MYDYCKDILLRYILTRLV